ncbi:MAG: carboxypeptidase M32 [Oscillospiraceae bacterium]|nr:carboxypeptidase M32 [Oscillospiraceae bacterium]
MTREEKLRRFAAWEEKLGAYEYAMRLIGVDNQAQPPTLGAPLRNERAAILSGEALKLRQDEEMYDIVREMQQWKDLDPVLRRRAELHEEAMRNSRCVPPEEYMAYQRTLSESGQAWLRCKRENDFAAYAPYLARLVEAHKRLFEHRRTTLSLYDTMLDSYERGWTSAQYDDFFAQMKSRLVPLIRRVRSAEPIDRSFLQGHFDVDAQRKYMQRITDYLGFTREWGKMGESEHPLTTWISENDVRITTKYRPYNAVDGVLSTVHETGHAWYVHNVDPAYDGTVLISRMGMAMHESQSRLCENHLGRSRAFWEYNYPGLREAFPAQFGGVELEQFYRGINESHPSLIRTEADELTYPLHILIRYEIEKELFGGTLAVADLEEVWNEKYRSYLGVEVPDAARGVLQDMHWGHAYLGYFPTYALGSAFAAQFFRAMAKEIDVDDLLRRGEYPTIMAWLREHVHRYGCMYSSAEVLRRATGEEFNAAYYFDYLERKYTELYHLDG